MNSFRNYDTYLISVHHHRHHIYYRHISVILYTTLESDYAMV